MKLWPLVASLLMALLVVSSCEKAATELPAEDLLYQQGNTPVMTGIACLDSMPYGRLSPDEHRAIYRLRKTELLAHDLCLALQHPTRPDLFEDVTPAEARHANLVLALITRYSLVDPCANHQAGVFQDSTFQSLYDRLLSVGSQSWPDALNRGAFIEEFQISALQECSQVVDQRDLARVFDLLELQSRNQFRLFYAELLGQGAGYSPSLIDRVYFSRMIHSRQESGSLCP